MTNESLARNDVIARIRAGLKRRTGHAWSVTGGRGTAYGWIHVSTPRAHQMKNGRVGLSQGEAIALAKVLGFAEPIHFQGWSIPASHAYYRDAIQRAEKGMSEHNPQPYWD